MIRSSRSVMTLFLCMLALPLKTLSNQTYEDVVHLKNNSIIHGAIVQLSPNDSVMIKTVGGSQLNFKMNEVSKVTMSVMKSDKDVVYLKDKSIIHGSIVTFIPNESLMIQIEGGSKFNFSIDEVLKVEIDNSIGSSSQLPPSPKTAELSRKSPFIAAGLSSVIPGLGQFYNRQFYKGGTFAFITIGSIASLIALDETDNDNAIVTKNALGPIIAFGCFVNWLVGTYDAYHYAASINARLDWEQQLSLSPFVTPNRIGVLLSRRF